ncbi:alanine aminotransferase 2-like isoform X2 [Hippocampus comes]|uniref:alanine aminotransferase 2-like isoform X2 n=1 Tax=Hippocampus comes TaxID=109280 RepID=UPI00094EA45F|nr:PREDICTED: alanine aminotransferase 2-like isoform X2 [Hippocampus comes]
MSSHVRTVRPNQMVALMERAAHIKKMLEQGEKKPYKDVIDVCWGDPHGAGMKPLTFVRQVLAACIYPQLLDGGNLPMDVKRRAQKLLRWCDGGSVGSYTNTGGILEIVENLAQFISQRDGVPAHPENIWIHPGSQTSLTQSILTLLLSSEATPKRGVLVPVPGHSTVPLSVAALGGVAAPYFLDEERGWELRADELRRALASARGVCRPVALYVINPGNPTGHVQSRKSMEEVIRFVAENNLFLLADEVYQGSVYDANSEFVSYKKRLYELGPPLAHTLELASFHSASKGLLGECGLRGGYVELLNMDPVVMPYVERLFHLIPSPPVTGQIALELMVEPPQPGDPSYPLYMHETEHTRRTLVDNVKRVLQVLNRLPAISCQPVRGGAFAFPRLHLTTKAIRKAKDAGMQPDMFYCTKLLEDTGVFVSPGCEYGQKEGTYHIRFCIMTPTDTMEELLRRLSAFHLKFMKDLS